MPASSLEQLFAASQEEMCAAEQGGPEPSNLLGDARVSTGALCACCCSVVSLLWPSDTTQGQNLISQFGLSDLVAPLRVFEAGRVQSNLSEKTYASDSANISWVFMMIYSDN